MSGRDLQRIAVVGICGGGKTTIAQQLGKALDLPVVHLDQHFHLPNFQEPDRQVWAKRYAALEAEPRWIIDGNYSAGYASRLQLADLVVHVRSSTPIAVWRVLRRAIAHRGQARPEAAPGCVERPLSWQFLAFLWWVARFNGRQLPRLQRALAQVPADRIVVVRSIAEADALVTQLAAVR